VNQRPTPPTAQGDAPYASYVVTLLAAVYALNIADRYVMSVLIEPIRAELHLTDSAIGFLTGVSLGCQWRPWPIARTASV